MNNNDLSGFAKVMAKLGNIYHIDVTEDLCETYWVLLAPYLLDSVKKAVLMHLKDPERGSYMPKPADLIRNIEGSKYECANEAWHSVTQAISRYGRYESIEFQDHLIAQVIRDLGGWIKLCDASLRELFQHGQEFRKKYITYCENPPKDCIQYIRGVIESLNAESYKDRIVIKNKQGLGIGYEHTV